MNLDNHSQHVIAAALQASARGRWSTLAVIVASVVTFAAAWNATPFSWTSSILASAYTVEKWLLWAESNEDVPAEIDDQEAQILKHFTGRTHQQLRDLDVKKRSAMLARIQSHISELNQNQVSRLMVIELPIFGVPMLINDLGLFSGIAFVVLILMQRYSIARELDNVRLVFGLGGAKDDERAYYDLLAMGQVLMIPPGSGVGRAPIWQYLPNGLLAVPAAVQLFVLGVDAVSLSQAWIHNRTYTVLVASSEIISLTVVVVLSLSCWKLRSQLHRLWIGQWAKISDQASAQK